MRKTNIMKSLKIKKDKIIIEDASKSKKEGQINEDLTDDFLAIGKSSVDAVKNIGKTAGIFAKATMKTLFSPVAYLVSKWWKGETASLKGFLKSVEKNLDGFSEDVDSLVKDWNNDNRQMMQAAGFSDKEAEFFMLSISPPLGIANLLYDAVYNKRRSSVSTSNLENKNNMLELVVYFIAFFITGNDNASDADVIRKIKSEILKFIKSIFNENTYKVLSNLHLSDKWGIHGTNLQAEFKPVTKKINFKDAFANPIKEIQRLKAANIDSAFNEVIEDVKNYCNNNYNKKTESSMRTLNLKSKLILEKIENVDEISRLAFAIACIIFSNDKVQENMMQAVLNSEFGNSAQDLKKLLKARGDVKNIMQHLTLIYTNFVFCEFVMQVSDKLLENKNDDTYDFLDDIPSIESKIESDYFKGVPSEYQSPIDEISKKIKEKIKSDFKTKGFKDNPIANIQICLRGLTKNLIDLPEFNYDVYKDGILFNKLQKTKFLAKADEDFWRFISGKKGIDNIKSRAKEQENAIKDYIDSQKK